jgi:uncharacterized protein YbaA (DUF1428 family)
MPYVDGFVLPIAKNKVASYRRLAAQASKVWKDHGALEFHESVGDDLDNQWGVSFTKLAKAKRGETVIFSWIVYRTKGDRNRINNKVMKDPRIAKMMNMKNHPFDVKRMAMGGFKTIVDA